MKDLIIAARPAKGFRRCGVHHPPAEVRHKAGDFTPAQVEALKREPNLMVIEVEPASAGRPADAAGAKAGMRMVGDHGPGIEVTAPTAGTSGEQETQSAAPPAAAPPESKGTAGGRRGGRKAASPPALPPAEPPAGDPPAA